MTGLDTAEMIRTGQLHSKLVSTISRIHHTCGSAYHPRGILQSLSDTGLQHEELTTDPEVISELETLMAPGNYHTYQEIADAITKKIAERADYTE